MGYKRYESCLFIGHAYPPHLLMHMRIQGPSAVCTAHAQGRYKRSSKHESRIRRLMLSEWQIRLDKSYETYKPSCQALFGLRMLSVKI